MKKAVAIFMLLIIFVSLVSCGNQEVKAKLIEGTWVYEGTALSTQYTQTYEFEEDGKVTVLFKIPMQTVDVNFGTYTIENGNEIVVTMEDNDPPPYSFYFTYEDNSLRLFNDAEHTEELYQKK